MARKTPKNTGKKSPVRGRGRGRKEDPSLPKPSPPRTPSDGEDAGSNGSRALSGASIAACEASASSQPTLAKKTQYCLDFQEEQLMCDFLRDNPCIWDIKKTDYRRVDKKAKLWEDQGKTMAKPVEHLQGWFKSL